jgi:hypothetical protein
LQFLNDEGAKKAGAAGDKDVFVGPERQGQLQVNSYQLSVISCSWITRVLEF